MVKRQVRLANKLGLHAGASDRLRYVASRFECDIFLRCRGATANAKSVMQVMMMPWQIDSMLDVIANGVDEQRAVDDIVELINRNFYEDAGLSVAEEVKLMKSEFPEIHK